MPALLKIKSSARPLSYRVRAAMDLNQTEFAAQIGASLRSVKNWESGRVRPSGAAQKALLELARKYRVDSNDNWSASAGGVIHVPADAPCGRYNVQIAEVEK